MGIERRKVRPVLSAREVAFIKHSAFRDDNLLCSWIVELPALVTSWIANEDRLLHVRTQRSPLILLYMDIGKTAPNAKVRDVRFAIVEGVKGSCTRSRRGGTPVQNMHKGGQSFSPE